MENICGRAPRGWIHHRRVLGGHDANRHPARRPQRIHGTSPRHHTRSEYMLTFSHHKWHDNLWMVRHLLFLAFPILLHALPKSPPRPNPAPLMTIARAQLQKAQQQLVNTRFVHAAMERQPALRAASTEWWERQRVEGEWARSDEHVRRAAEKLGKGIQEGAEGPAGKLSQRTKDALRQIFESLGLTIPQ